MTTVTLHLVDLDDPTLSDTQLERCVGETEAARGRRFRDRGNRHRFLTGRAALRSVLARRLGCAPCDVPLREGLGRPELIGGGAGFSLSRSAGRGLIALSPASPVGCDLEWIDPAFDVRTTATVALSARERELLDRADPATVRRLFFDAWVLKEAYLKARGVGLTEPPDALTVLHGDRPAAFGLPAGWAWSFLDLGPDWSAAVVAPDDQARERPTLRGLTASSTGRRTDGAEHDLGRT